MKTNRPLFFLFAMILLIGTACKGSKATAWTPVGNWDFAISDTPVGNVKGVMVLTKDGDSYTGEMRTEEGTLDLEDIKVEEQKMTATLYYEGYQLTLEGTFTGDMMDGAVSMGYDSFTLKATRQ
ncbi:MAG: hypothetical protein AAFP02_14335 [Bacteroidota bacterium]